MITEKETEIAYSIQAMLESEIEDLVSRSLQSHITVSAGIYKEFINIALFVDKVDEPAASIHFAYGEYPHERPVEVSVAKPTPRALRIAAMILNSKTFLNISNHATRIAALLDDKTN